MQRISLFLLTNLAVMVLAGVTLNLLGVGSILAANGVDLDMGALLAFCGVFGMSGAFVSLLLSKFMAKQGTGTQILTQARNREEQWLLDTVAELAREAGIGMPEVGVFPAEQPNAFATGWNRNQALVAVSTGLLRSMGPQEVRAVLAHEIGHVANGDMVTLALVQGVVNTFVMFLARLAGFFVDRVLLKNERGLGMGYFITSIVMELVLGMLAMTVVMWVSRRREFRADAFGARLAGRDAMIGALERLRSGDQLPDAMPATLQAFGIRPGHPRGFDALFRSHPPLEDRIAALRNG
ncbi:MAG: protease HtpX [Pseudomonadales bacterium]|nr:protease HtpX [Pseudomonadales bacterium]MBL6807852.1 protease HtpX [Pseudomonadales bacterium]